VAHTDTTVSSAAVNVGAMLIAFIGLIALLNGMVSGVMAWFGYLQLNLEALVGHAFSPLAWLIGVPWGQSGIAGNLIGQKLILNEFVGYVGLVHSRRRLRRGGTGVARPDRALRVAARLAPQCTRVASVALSE
jgi:CNT family concentrative nucleoside transporter